MLVQNKHLTTIWYEQNTDKIKIIDQRFIPFELKIVELNTVDEVCFAIKEMQVRGAPLIGVTAAYGLYLASKNNSDIENLIQSAKQLKDTRPTAVNLAWAVNKIIKQITDVDKNKRSENILQIANKIREDDIKSCSNIGDNGLKLLEEIYINNMYMRRER